MTSAAIVLPVPEGPANSAVTPLPSDSRRPKPHSSSTWCRCTTCWHISCSCASVSVGQHDLRPVVHGSILWASPSSAGSDWARAAANSSRSSSPPASAPPEAPPAAAERSRALLRARATASAICSGASRNRPASCCKAGSLTGSPAAARHARQYSARCSCVGAGTFTGTTARVASSGRRPGRECRPGS